MLKHKVGDVLALAEAGEFDVVVQGCNCWNTMGSGIARQIRENFPDAYAADSRTEAGDYTKLGNYTLAVVGMASPFVIVNAYTQFNFNRTGESTDLFEYAAFELILQKLAHELPGTHFGFPYIGMGLAGGNQQRIIGLLEWFADTVTKTGGSVTLVEFG